MKRVTVDNVMSWGPCPGYPRKRIKELFTGRETLGWREIAAMDLPAADLLWWLLRPEFLSERRLHLLACDFAEAVLPLADDPRSAEAIRVKHLWVDGTATDEELNAALEAAWAAAGWKEYPARAAARAAAHAADWDASEAAAARTAVDAAWVAAREAREARAAARAALDAGDAARAAAREARAARETWAARAAAREARAALDAGDAVAREARAELDAGDAAWEAVRAELDRQLALVIAALEEEEENAEHVTESRV